MPRSSEFVRRGFVLAFALSLLPVETPEARCAEETAPEDSGAVNPADELLRRAAESHARCSKKLDDDARTEAESILARLSERNDSPAVYAVRRFYSIEELADRVTEALLEIGTPAAHTALVGRAESHVRRGRSGERRCPNVALFDRFIKNGVALPATVLRALILSDPHVKGIAAGLEVPAESTADSTAVILSLLDAEDWGASRSLRVFARDDIVDLFVPFFVAQLEFLERTASSRENASKPADAKPEGDDAANSAGTKSTETNSPGAGTAVEDAGEPESGSAVDRTVEAELEEFRRRRAARAIVERLRKVAMDVERSSSARLTAIGTLRTRPVVDRSSVGVEILGSEIEPDIIVAAASLVAVQDAEAARPHIAARLKEWTRSRKDASLEDSIAALLEMVIPLGVEDAAPAVEKLARSSSSILRGAAIAALPIVGAERAYGRVRGALKDRVWRVREGAIEACRAMKTAKAVSLLIDRMDKEDGELRVALLGALHDLTGAPMPYAPDDWEKWWSYSKDSYRPPGARRSGKSTVLTFPDAATYFGLEVLSKNVCFVVDVSGSMAAALEYKGKETTRLRVLKEQLHGILDGLAKEARINVIHFHSEFRPFFSQLVPLTKRNRAVARDLVRRLNASGGTNIFDPLAAALRDSRVDTIFLLSDGRPGSGKWVDTEDILGAVRALNRKRLTRIHTISIGEDSSLLRRLARQNFGTYVAFD